MKRLAMLAACTVLSAATAQVMAMGEFTYVDATPDGTGANITVQGAPVVHPANYPTIAAGENFYLNDEAGTTGPAEADDGIWGERVRATCNGGSVLVAKDNVDPLDDGDAILWTSTASLPAGKYYVYLFFWNNGNGGGEWDCKAAIGEHQSVDTLSIYTKDNAVNLVGQKQFDGYVIPGSVLVDDGAQDLMAAKLGEITLGSDGPITVSTAGVKREEIAVDQRTWFDGIGYVLVEPCDEIPDVTVGPIEPGATMVTVNGIDPSAQSVGIFRNEGTDPIASLQFSGPAPASVDVPVLSSQMLPGSRIDARQTIDGVRRCRMGTQTFITWPKRFNYVDAIPNQTGTDGNTTIDGALVDFPNNAVSGSSAPSGHLTDGKWWFRSGRANLNGGNVWETGTAEVIASPLVTTLTLPPGVYNLYGMFYNESQNTGRWDVGFRVGNEGNPITWNGWQNATNVDQFNGTNTNLGGELFVTPIKTRDTGFWLCMAPLGQYEVTDTIDVYIYSPIRPNVADGGNQRTWYDGIAYELVEDLPPALTGTPGGPRTLVDGFGDGDRNNDGQLDDPDGSGAGVVDDANDTGLAWRKVDLGNSTVRVGPDVAEPAGLGTDNALHVIAPEHGWQVANFEPVSLKVPDAYIRLSFKWRMSTLVHFGDSFRFGLFHDGGTPVTFDMPVLDLVRDDPGYVLALATGSGGAGHYAIGHSDHWWGGLALNPTPLFGQDVVIWDQTPPFLGNISDTLPHEIVLTISRRDDDRVNIEVAIDGGVPSKAEYILGPAPYTDRAPVLLFNEVAFGSSPVLGGNPSIDYIIDDVVIETGVYADPCENFVGDIDGDEDVDMVDFAAFQRCLTPPVVQFPTGCECFDFDKDYDIDLDDLDAFAGCAGGAGVDPLCLPTN